MGSKNRNSAVVISGGSEDENVNVYHEDKWPKRERKRMFKKVQRPETIKEEPEQVGQDLNDRESKQPAIK